MIKRLLLLALLPAAAIAIAGYDYVGEGFCQDANSKSYPSIKIEDAFADASSCSAYCDMFRYLGDEYRGFWYYDFKTCSCLFDAASDTLLNFKAGNSSVVYGTVDDRDILVASGAISGFRSWSSTECYKVVPGTAAPTPKPTKAPLPADVNEIAGYEFMGKGRCRDYGGEDYEGISEYYKNNPADCGPNCDPYRLSYGEAFRGFSWDYYVQGYGSSNEYGTCRCLFDAGTLEEPIDDNVVRYLGYGMITSASGYTSSSATDVCYKAVDRLPTTSPSMPPQTKEPSTSPSLPPQSISTANPTASVIEAETTNPTPTDDTSSPTTNNAQNSTPISASTCYESIRFSILFPLLLLGYHL